MSQQPLVVAYRKLKSCLRQEGLRIFRSFKGQPPDLLCWTIYPTLNQNQEDWLISAYGERIIHQPCLASSSAYLLAGEGHTSPADLGEA